MSTKIYFVRHADVENPENLLYGRLTGFPLSRLGQVQAKELGDLFNSKSITAVYSSPQLRCRQTARSIALAHNLPVLISRLIQEVDSSFDGINKKEFENIEPALSNSTPLAEYPCESKEAIERRMLLFVGRVARHYKNCSIVAVSHGDPLVILKAKLEKKNFDWEYKKANYVAKGCFFEIVV